NLETPGVHHNTRPSVLAMGVVEIERREDTAKYSLTSANAASIATSLRETGAANQSNTFSIAKTGGQAANAVHNVVDIVNVVTDQSDNRYGDEEDVHDLVYTGFNYCFTD